MTWTCEQCGEERPDAAISVLKVPHPTNDFMTRNLRYCNDRPECVRQAAAWSWPEELR